MNSSSGGEALIRNLEIRMTPARRFGRPLDVRYFPDQFGRIAQMPQILAGFGFKPVLWRGVLREINRNRFIWGALDGSRVFTVYSPATTWRRAAAAPAPRPKRPMRRSLGAIHFNLQSRHIAAAIWRPS
jgi:Glycosyl hydrolases family 38 N-terminal domain